MGKLNSGEIIKVLDNLIGETTAVGDFVTDTVIDYNLRNLIDITNWCLDGIAQSAVTRHSFNNSMRQIGERAFSALVEYRDFANSIVEPD
jgi:hypothetical protein